MSKLTKLSLADIVFQVEWIHEENGKRCSLFKVEGKESDVDEIVSWRDIRWDEAPLERLRKDAICEFNNILIPVSDRLLKYDSCVTHGTAFSWNDKGYLFMAPSGTGKTTQYINWKKEYSDEVHILNGDKPILQRNIEGRFFVCPSPWKGKEGWGNMEKVPLSGIIYLIQASKNHVRLADPAEMSVRILQELLYSVDSTELIMYALDFTKALITGIPIWILTNRGDMESVHLLHDVLKKQQLYES